MNIENYVSTLEQSKKLDAILGKRKSIFYWTNRTSIYSNRKSVKDQAYLYSLHTEMEWNDALTDLRPRWECLDKFNAYTSQELGEIIEEKFGNHHDSVSRLRVEHEKCEPEAHARAEFLIYLLESKDGDSPILETA